MTNDRTNLSTSTRLSPFPRPRGSVDAPYGVAQYWIWSLARSWLSMLRRAAGMQPVRVLPESQRVARLVRLPSWAGMAPVIWLLWR